jgi:hypothetical protein
MKRKREFKLDDSYSKVTCNSCGRYHKKELKSCDLAQHPDRNKSGAAWKDSYMGKIYKDSHGMDFIKPFKKLSNDKKSLVKNKIIQHETGKLNLNNLNHKPSNSFLTIFSIFSKIDKEIVMKFNTLIDSGAIDRNFISVKCAKILQDNGFKMDDDDSVIDMGVKNLTQSVLGNFSKLEFSFYNFVTKKYEILILHDVLVINSYNDLIIGRISMCKHDLWNKLFQNICYDCCDDNCKFFPQKSVINNISNKLVREKDIKFSYDNTYMNNIFINMKDSWIDDVIDDLLDINKVNSIPMIDGEDLNKSIHEFNSLRHTGSIPNQKIGEQIIGLPNVKPGDIIKLSSLLTPEHDGTDPEDLKEMDSMDDILDKMDDITKRNVNKHLANIIFPKVLANLKISDPVEDNEFLISIKFSGPVKLQKTLKDLCIEFKDIFSSTLSKEPAFVKPLKIDIDLSQWESPKNCSRSRLQTEEKEGEIKNK